MRRITDVRLPHPLERDADQRHTLTLDQNLQIQAIKQMTAGDAEEATSWGGTGSAPAPSTCRSTAASDWRFRNCSPTTCPD